MINEPRPGDQDVCLEPFHMEVHATPGWLTPWRPRYKDERYRHVCKTVRFDPLHIDNTDTRISIAGDTVRSV